MAKKKRSSRRCAIDKMGNKYPATNATDKMGNHIVPHRNIQAQLKRSGGYPAQLYNELTHFIV